MSLTIDSPTEATTEASASDAAAENDESIGQRLQAETTAVRLKIRWMGVRKTLSQDQTRLAAGTFDADIKSVSATKKLFDTSHPAMRAATAVRTQAVDYWKSQTLPYIEPGVRLLRRRDVAAFDDHMTSVSADLKNVIKDLEDHYGELISQARERLGNLFDPSDYAASLDDLFAIQWEYPACDPPEYLLRLSPSLYYNECARVQTRFDEAVRLAEQAFATELGQLVSHLAERLSGGDGGSGRIFRDTAVTNLLDFFDRFQRLNIRSDEQLDRLVADARRVISGVRPQDLRDHAAMRQQVASELVRVEASLDGWMTDRPRRSIQRRAR